VTSTYVPAPLRQQVRSRARLKCEYCLLGEAHAFFPHEPDHVIAIKHGGETTEANLALACFDCNRFKGSDIASIDAITGQLFPLFNPRSQTWSDHFKLNGGRIIALSDIGRVTERLLKLNLAERVEVRETLAKTRRYPSS
jgi:HNH endonuclease